MKKQKASGKTLPFLDESHIKTEELIAFKHPRMPRQLIRTDTKEFSAVCPFSGLPDIAEVIIEYHPDGGLAVELKSLKYYFMSFRNVGIYQEGVTNRIYNDLRNLLKTSSLVVTTYYNIRGGFNTKTEVGHLSWTQTEQE